MNLEEKELTRALTAFICQETMTFSPDLNWEKFFYLAEIHNVVPIIYYKLKENPGETDAAELARWSAAGKGIVMQMVRQEFEISRVTDRLNREKILHVLLKGYQLRKYYPVQELRTRGDVDMLIPMEERAHADRILLEMGYEKTNGSGFVWNYHKHHVEIEVHVKLAEGEYWKKTDCETCFATALAHVMDGEQPFTKYLDREYNFVFLMFHLAKHFYAKGAGLRMFLDFAVYIQKFDEEMDWDYVEKELSALNLNQFAQNVLYMCREWFGVKSRFLKTELDDRMYERFCQYVFTGGVFGHENPNAGLLWIREAIKNGKSESQFQIKCRALLEYAFPDRNYMRKFLPGVEKHGWLMPAAWLIRWYGGIFKRRKQMLENLLIFTKDMSGTEEQLDFLEKIGV